MKKILNIAIVILLTLAITACGTQTGQNEEVLDPAKETVEDLEKNQFEEIIEAEPEIRQEVYDLMVAYEEFIDYYCGFMREFMAADLETQVDMMDDYLALNTKVTKCQEAMNEIFEEDRDEFTDDEINYMVAVNLRISNKLLDTASDGLSNYQEAG